MATTLSTWLETLLKWALGLLVSINSAVMLYVLNKAVDLAKNDAVKSEQIQTIRSDVSDIKVLLSLFKQEQKVKDDKQDEQIKIVQFDMILPDRLREKKSRSTLEEDDK